MKEQRLFFIYVFLLMLGISYSSVTYSQSQTPTPTCAICGGKNGVHSPTCRYYNPPSGNPKSQSAGMPRNVQQLNNLIDLFNTPFVSKEAEAKKEAAIKEARDAKQREEILKKERHNREMKTFKPLDGDPGPLRSDNESHSGLTLKPLPQNNAPMTMDERERQNLLKHGAGITWNYNDFTSALPGDRIPEPAPMPGQSENENLINDMIGTVESNGGRLAAITGRYMLNVKDGVMNYLDDATYAVTSGNSYIMKETGEFEVRKISTNALYKAASQTAQAYYENARETLISGIKNESIGIMKNATISKLNEFKYSDNLARAWKQPH